MIMARRRRRTRRTSSFIALSLLSILSSYSGVKGTSVCPYEPFPIDFLRNGGAWHIQGEFYIDLTKETTVPLSIEHASTYIRLSLQNFTGYIPHAAITDSEVASPELLKTDTWGHLSGIIEETGKYALRINGEPISSATGPSSCTHGYIEFFARPHSEMVDELIFYSGEGRCGNINVLPEIDFTDIEDLHYVSDKYIDKGHDYYVLPDTTGHIDTPWTFTVPSDATSSHVLSANLRTEFGSGGSLRVLLQTNYSGSFPEDVNECVKLNKCVIGTKTHLNSETLTSMLPPGDYAMWFYWGNDNSSIVSYSCIPFGLTLDITSSKLIDGFIDCNARALPASLNGIGSEVIDSNGRLHLHRPILLESISNVHTTSFTISKKSYLRIHASIDTKVNIDISVTNSSSYIVEHTFSPIGDLFSDPTLSSPFALSAIIEPDKYEVTILGQATAPCTSMDFDLEIVPVEDIVDFCLGVGEDIRPDLSGMGNLSSMTDEFHFNDGNSGFTHMYKASGSSSIKYKQQTILEQEFTITGEASMFRARIGSNFVLNDVTMVIEDEESGEIMHPRHKGPNAQVFDIHLVPGHYIFRILTGLVQDAFDYKDYPACAIYTLSIDIVPKFGTSTTELVCGSYRELPVSLNDAEWLETSDTVFTLEEFRVPQLTAGKTSIDPLTGRSSMEINVDKTSYLHVYVSELDKKLDIDVRLYKDGQPASASVSKMGKDVSFSYILEADTDYSLLLMFVYDPNKARRDDSVDCLTYTMEIMIAPYNEEEVIECPKPKLPTNATVFPESGVIDGAFDHVGTYWMPRGTNSDVMARLSFKAKQSLHFRALVLGDFLYSQFALRLEGSSTVKNAQGTLIRGGWELAVDTLPPGTYTLEIYAPFYAKSLPEGILRTACMGTLLHIGAEPVYIEKSNVTTSVNCKYTNVPETFSTPGFIHILTGQHSVINGRYRANIDDGHDDININLEEDSIYRVLIPDMRKGSSLDIDVELYEGTTEVLGKLVDRSSNSESAEELYGNISAGTYVLKFTYWGIGAAYPYGGCISFPVYAEFAPLEKYEVTEECSEITKPKDLAFDQKVTETCKWSPSAKEQYHAELPLLITSDAARVRVEIASNDFIPGGLTFLITGRTTYGLLEVAARVDSAAGAGGRAWLDEYLLTGTYSLHIVDQASRDKHGAVERIGCAEYNITYHIDTNVDPESEGVCPVAEKLPTDLYTARGGSVEYGGPQADDGTVFVVGEHFLLPHDSQDRVRWTQAMISEPSFIRVFAHTLDPNSIDLYLYRDRNNESSRIGFTVSIEDYVNALWYFDPNTVMMEDDVSTTVDIQTRIFNEDESRPCNYFHWGVAVRPRSKAAKDIVCPGQLPPEKDRVPPETVRITSSGTLVPSSSNYVFTSKFIDTHTSNELFTYKMTLDATQVSSATVTVDMSFNFLLNDFTLILRDYETKEKLSTGTPTTLPNRHGSLNFRNTFTFVISQGKYILEIKEDVAGKSTFINTTYCMPFDFVLTAQVDGPSPSPEPSSSESDSSFFAEPDPEITYVYPQTMQDIEPCGNLFVDIHFNQPPDNIPDEDLASFLNTHRMIVLSESNDPSGAPAHPIEYAVLSENSGSDWVIGLRYAGDLLELGYTYTLHVNASTFLNPSGVAFTDPAVAAGAEYQYSVATCNCSGHGTCTVTGIVSECLICDCEEPWTGLDCSACKKGYHISPDGSKCVPNPVCEPDSCNGHGTCDSSTGTIVCTCDTGYASPVSTADNPCSICAVGYTGYPKCVYDAEAAGADCAEPLLPDSLGTVPYMGWKGYVDIADTFHIDLTGHSHDIKFELDRDSLFRVYAVPNSDYDVDLWLYKVDPIDESETIIAYETSMENSEAMYIKLSGGPSGEVATKYLLRLRYYAWGDMYGEAVVSPCETLDLSLSISPVDAMQPVFDEMSEYCAPEDDLPNISFTEISEDVVYAPEHNFTVRAAQSFTTKPRYFWSHDFVLAPQGYHTIMFQAYVGARFLPGQLSLLLERFPDSSDEPNHCADGSERCVSGEGTLNGNFLHRALQDGKYRLWLLEPALQDTTLSNCSIFEFSFRVEYLDVTDAVFECDGNTGSGSAGELPATLNAPGYLDASGSVHVNDRFAIYGKASTVEFDLSEKSHFRVASVKRDSAGDGTLFAICTGDDTCSEYESELLHVLEPGHYTMHVQQPISWHDGRLNKCIIISMELAIEPVSRAVIAPCPANATYPDPTPVLPEFEVLSVPFSYGTDDDGEYIAFMAPAPYRSITSRIGQYTIEITESSTLDASVMSSFLYHSVSMSLYHVSTGTQLHVASSYHAYNSQRITELLFPGTYLLTLDASVIPRPDSLPTCVPFNFEIEVLPLTEESAACDLSREPIPHSFNGYRFAGTNGGFNFVSSDFKVIYGLAGTETDRIPITITSQSSLINAYVAPNTVVDIDIELLDSNDNLIAKGVSESSTEESFAVVVPKGDYTFLVRQWNWGTEPVSGCQTFTMQISVTPEYGPQACPSGEEDEEWPPEYPAEIENEYEYTSGTSGLWYRQKVNDQVARAYNFHLDHTSDFAAQTRYTLQSGQLNLLLQRVVTDEETGMSTIAESHYSDHGNGRSTLKVMGIPAGDYVLTIYEPTPSPNEIAGCNHYGFTTFVRRKRAHYLTEDMMLPATLNTVPYLGFDYSMHTQDTFVLFRGREHEETTFTIYKQSIAHIHAILQAEYVRNKFLNLTLTRTEKNGTEVQVAMDTTELHVVLEVGEYRLAIVSNGEVLEMEGGGVLSDVEISIQPVTKIREVVAAEPRPSTCADSLVPPITISPEGYYFYDGDDKSLAVSYATFSKSKGGRIQRLKLEINVPTRIYAQIGYEYALGNLELEIATVSASGARAVGIQQRNFNTLRTTLEAGTYYLDILNPTPPPSLAEPLEYCFPFTFVISVVPSSKGGSGGGCLYRDPVPWDLNRYDGGSVRFGGPIDATGSLLLYGSTFAVPAGVTSSEMAFSTKEDTALSVLLTAGTGLNTVHAHLYDAVTRKPIDPLGSTDLVAGAQQLITFAVTTKNNTGGSYYIVLHYGEISGDCAEFAMQVEIKPLALLKSALVCDEGFVPSDPPKQRIVPDDHGFARDIRASAFYSDEPIAPPGSPYDIDLALNTTSNVVTTLSFSPMANLYGLSIVTFYEKSSVVRSSATLRTQSQMSSSLATVTLALSDTLGVTSVQSPTRYGLRISQDNWTSPVDIGQLPTKKLCFPYIYTAYVIPQNGLPYVKEVSPAGARDLSPGETFTIYVTFSTAVYEAGTGLKKATEETIKKAFYLYDRMKTSTSTHIFPESCVQVSSDTSRWGITFVSEHFAPLIDYQLGFVENILVDSTEEEVKYVYVNIYHTIDTTCNAHGKLVDDACLCDEGYAGLDCKACDIGYFNFGTGTTGKEFRCLPAMTCEENTCGCDYEDDTYQTCNPLGECDVNSSTGLAQCECKKGYTGQFCQKCIDGWDGWPRCIPCFNGASWDTVKNRCVCAGNFAGPKCQECKFGYSGKNCETYGGAVFAILLGFVIIAVSVVILVFVVKKVKASRSTRTYQHVLTSGEGYDDDIIDDDDDNDWMSSPVPSATREAKKKRKFTIRRPSNEVFSDDGLQGSINNDINDDIDFFAEKKDFI